MGTGTTSRFKLQWMAERDTHMISHIPRKSTCTVLHVHYIRTCMYSIYYAYMKLNTVETLKAHLTSDDGQTM